LKSHLAKKLYDFFKTNLSFSFFFSGCFVFCRSHHSFEFFFSFLCAIPVDLSHVLFSFLFSIFHKINHQMSTSMQRNDSFHHSRNLNLIDDSVLEDSSGVQHNSLHIPHHQQNDAISTGSSEEMEMMGDYSESSIINNLDSPLDCMSFQGCVRRKTVLKDGRKPAVASWQRYWLQIWANSLVYFPPKSFKG